MSSAGPRGAPRRCLRSCSGSVAPADLRTSLPRAPTALPHVGPEGAKCVRPSLHVLGPTGHQSTAEVMKELGPLPFSKGLMPMGNPPAEVLLHRPPTPKHLTPAHRALGQIWPLVTAPASNLCSPLFTRLQTHWPPHRPPKCWAHTCLALASQMLPAPVPSCKRATPT